MIIANRNNVYRLVAMLLCLLSVQACKADEQDEKLSTLSTLPTFSEFPITSTKALKEFFRYRDNRIPFICAHRGGATVGYPENAIVTFEHTLSRTDAIFEIDPRLTKDGVIVAFHDETLDRTTNGTGKLSDYTWAELKQLKLKDTKGNITPYGIHKLEEVLQWAKGKTILILDKKDVPYDRLLQLIELNKAEAHVLVSTYHLKEAQYYYKRNPNIMFEAIIKDKEVMKSYEDAGIPWGNIVAFTGQPSNTPSNALLNAMLHERGVMCMVSTVKFQDKEKNKNTRATAYRDLITNGKIDILMSNMPIDLAEALLPLVAEPSSRYKFFKAVK